MAYTKKMFRGCLMMWPNREREQFAVLSLKKKLFSQGRREYRIILDSQIVNLVLLKERILMYSLSFYLFYSEQPKLNRLLAVLSAIGLKVPTLKR